MCMQREEPAETERFRTPMYVSEIALLEAMIKLGPAFIYDLYVAPDKAFPIANFVRPFVYAPLASQINVRGDPQLTRDSWYLEANGRRVGCDL